MSSCDRSGYTACGIFTNYIDDLTVQYNNSLVYTYNFAYGYV